jgi:hypothetical protein
VTPGDTLQTVLAKPEFQGNQITYSELVKFNWGTKDPIEVNRALVEQIGCRSIDWNEPLNTVLDPESGPTDLPRKILIPEPWKETGLSIETTHIAKAKPIRPAPAVSITTLDKWFIPGDETCAIAYSLEGVDEKADHVDCDIYASNHCSAKVAEDYSIQFVADSSLDPLPIFKQSPEFAQRGRSQPVKWKGESVVTSGVLKKRGEERCNGYTQGFTRGGE